MGHLEMGKEKRKRRSEKGVGLRVRSKSELCQLTTWVKWYNLWDQKKKDIRKVELEYRAVDLNCTHHCLL